MKSDVGDLSLINGRDLKCGVAGNFSAEEVAQVGKQIDAGLVKKCSDAARQSQESLIRMKYGGLLVNVYERNLAPASMLVDVTNIDELAKLAGRHNTVILHMALNFIHYYMVQYNGLTYRYVFSAGKRGVAEIEPPCQEVINYVNSEAKISAPELNEEELFSYVINNNRTTKTEVMDTVILKKIRL